MGGERSIGSFGDTVGSLCADDYKGINNQYVGQGKLILCRVGVSETEAIWIRI